MPAGGEVLSELRKVGFLRHTFTRSTNMALLMQDLTLKMNWINLIFSRYELYFLQFSPEIKAFTFRQSQLYDTTYITCSRMTQHQLMWKTGGREKSASTYKYLWHWCKGAQRNYICDGTGQNNFKVRLKFILLRIWLFYPTQSEAVELPRDSLDDEPLPSPPVSLQEKLIKAISEQGKPTLPQSSSQQSSLHSLHSPPPAFSFIFNDERDPFH